VIASGIASTSRSPVGSTSWWLAGIGSGARCHQILNIPATRPEVVWQGLHLEGSGLIGGNRENIVRVVLIGMGAIVGFVGGIVVARCQSTLTLTLLKDAIQVFTAPAVLFALYVAWRRAKITEDGQVTDRFTKAVEQLGNTVNLAVRLGGIYALERIAQDSARDHWTVMEVLCSYLREHPGRAKVRHFRQLLEDPGLNPLNAEGYHEDMEDSDVQAIVAVLGRRRADRESEGQMLDLRETYLYKAKFRNLRGADLRSAYLDGADLRGANLREADLTCTYFTPGVDSNADLSGADLTGAILDRTNLSGADLRSALGITQTQISSARGDESAKLPEGLEIPKSWRNPEER
jgi:hypothetical protein